MWTYTRTQILDRIKEIINQSDFISKDIIKYSESIEDIEDLKKLLVLVFNWNKKENTMTENDKNDFTDKIIDIKNEEIKIYDKYEKEIRKKAEEVEDEEDKFDEELLKF